VNQEIELKMKLDIAQEEALHYWCTTQNKSETVHLTDMYFDGTRTDSYRVGQSFRVRVRDHTRFFITKKYGSGWIRDEIEREVSGAYAMSLPYVMIARIEKWREAFRVGALEIVFDDVLTLGLRFVEVEVLKGTIADALAFLDVHGIPRSTIVMNSTLDMAMKKNAL